MAKDYKSFSSAAKSRFRAMAKQLGYEQLTGIVYVKDRGDWYEGFSLQCSSYGNDFFYINYGVIVPNLWDQLSNKITLKNKGYILSNRLHDDHSQGFSNASKDDIVKSAAIALERYSEQASEWFNEISDLADIAQKYFETTHLNREQLGKHHYQQQLSAANYALLLRIAGKTNESLKWLIEAERLMALPIYFTHDDQVVHVKEKHARLCKPEKYEIEQHEYIKCLIKQMKNT